MRDYCVDADGFPLNSRRSRSQERDHAIYGVLPVSAVVCYGYLPLSVKHSRFSILNLIARHGIIAVGYWLSSKPTFSVAEEYTAINGSPRRKGGKTPRYNIYITGRSTRLAASTQGLYLDISPDLFGEQFVDQLLYAQPFRL